MMRSRLPLRFTDTFTPSPYSSAGIRSRPAITLEASKLSISPSHKYRALFHSS